MTKCKCLHLQGLAYFTYTEIVCSSLLINIKVFKMASLDIVFKNAKPRYAFFKSCAYLVNGPLHAVSFCGVERKHLHQQCHWFLHVISERGAPGQKHNVLQCVIYMMCSSVTSYLAFIYLTCCLNHNFSLFGCYILHFQLSLVPMTICYYFIRIVDNKMLIFFNIIFNCNYLI